MKWLIPSHLYNTAEWSWASGARGYGGVFITTGGSLTTKCDLTNDPDIFIVITGVVTIIKLMTCESHSVHGKSMCEELLYRECDAWNAC